MHTGLLSVETYTACDAPLLPERRGDLEALLAVCDVFSPNDSEARSMLQPIPDAEAAAAAGAGCAGG